MLRKIGIGVLIALTAVAGFMYYKTLADKQAAEQTDLQQVPQIEVVDYRDYEGDSHRFNFSVIVDTLYFTCVKDCKGYYDEGYAMGYSTYGDVVTSFEYGEEFINEGDLDQLTNDDLRIIQVNHFTSTDQRFDKCFGTRNVFDPKKSYVYAKNCVSVVGTDEFNAFYLPTFGRLKEYTSIPGEYKRSIVRYLKEQNMVDYYYLSPNPLRAQAVVAYGNFAHVANNSMDPKTDGMAVVFDEKNGQASRLVIFARTLSNKKFVAYEESFDFPITVQKFSYNDDIFADTEEPVRAQGDGLLITFTSTEKRAVFYEDALQRFVWYIQKPKSEIEVTSNASAEEDGE